MIFTKLEIVILVRSHISDGAQPPYCSFSISLEKGFFWVGGRGGGNGSSPLPRSACFARAQFSPPFPFLAPATQARYMTVHAATRRRLLEA